MPFEVSTRDGILTLQLDTPGSSINIFNHPTAHQLIEVLANVTPSTTRAIVFETAKPNSFINGVGLLLAHASQTHDDVMRASIPPWTAYRAVREVPVPTIAVIQGSCFGCGVEFALQCDYRIATDSCETQFYMTELNDYLFIPLFGSTWNLPEAVGLADAIDLLLWGERWDAAKARERGLIDETVRNENFEESQRQFVQRVLDGTQPSRRRGRVAWGASEDRAMDQARRRVASLPPQYHAVYSDALNLLEGGARQTGSYIDHQQQELRCSAASALSPIGKSAYAFFYLRQMASERAAGRPRGTPSRLTLAADDGGNEVFRAFASDLRQRTLPGVTFASAATADVQLTAARMVGSPPSPSPGGVMQSQTCPTVVVRLSPVAGLETDAELYAPAYRAGGRLIEFATRAGPASTLETDRAARLTRVLQRFGFAVARTTPTQTFVANRLLAGYFSPLIRFVELYDDVGVVNRELYHAGFVRRPHDLLAALDRHSVAGPLAAALGCTPSTVESLLAALENDRCADGRSEGPVIDALCISLLDAILTLRAASEVRDASITDLIARELLDFPRHLCSLCTWLKRDRVARAVERAPEVRPLVTEAAFESARAFVVEGREFYR